jgi:hypothetical protein
MQSNENVQLVNPRLLEVGYRKEKTNPFAMKAYFPFVGVVIRTPCRTATEAKTKAVEIWQQMCAEYDAAVAEMAKGDESAKVALVAEPTA